MSLESDKPGEFVVGLRLELRVDAVNLDSAYAQLVFELEPLLETFIGLQGGRRARFNAEFARMLDHTGQ